MLINCVAYQDGRKLADIAKEEIGNYVKRPDCFVWVAMYEPSPPEIKEMRSRTRATGINGQSLKSTATRCSRCYRRSR